MRLALVLLLVGCTAPRAYVSPPLRDRARVEFVGELEPGEREGLLDLLDACLEVYVADQGRAPRVRRVYLYLADRLTFPWLKLKRGQRLMGTAGAGEIHLAARGRFGMSAGPHELHHLATGDTGHKGPGWRRLDWLGRVLARE